MTKPAAVISGEIIRSKISLGRLEGMADWKEALQGRIECARVRLNLGLPDNDAQLVAEVADFAAECQRLCEQIRRTGERRLAA
jgi:hypothetical protein